MLKTTLASRLIDFQGAFCHYYTLEAKRAKGTLPDFSTAFN
jgi:hypothetical protein